MARTHWDPTNRRVRTWDDDGTLVDDRPFDEDENADLDAQITEVRRAERRATLLSRAETARASNLVFIGDTNITTAELVAQVKALSRQNNAVINLVLSMSGHAEALDSVD